MEHKEVRYIIKMFSLSVELVLPLEQNETLLLRWSLQRNLNNPLKSIWITLFFKGNELSYLHQH
jgi:hypothetical protein